MSASIPRDAPATDDPIRAVVTRLARPNRAGGAVIERAAILAEGADARAIVAWIMDHDGQPEAAVSSTSGGGLHGSRLGTRDSAPRTPLRYVLPAEALN